MFSAAGDFGVVITCRRIVWNARGFSVVGVITILLGWCGGLSKDESSSPSYYYSRPPHHTRAAFSPVSCEIARLIFVSQEWYKNHLVSISLRGKVSPGCRHGDLCHPHLSALISRLLVTLAAAPVGSQSPASLIQQQPPPPCKHL